MMIPKELINLSSEGWKHGAFSRGNKDDGTRGKINMSTQEFTIAGHPKNTSPNFRTGQKTGTGRVEVRIENAERVVQDPHHVTFMHAPTFFLNSEGFKTTSVQ